MSREEEGSRGRERERGSDCLRWLRFPELFAFRKPSTLNRIPSRLGKLQFSATKTEKGNERGEEDGGAVTTTLFYIGRPPRRVKNSIATRNSVGAIARKTHGVKFVKYFCRASGWILQMAASRLSSDWAYKRIRPSCIAFFFISKIRGNEWQWPRVAYRNYK